MPPKKGKSGGAKGGGSKGGAKGGECMLQILTSRFRFLAPLFFICTLISVGSMYTRYNIILVGTVYTRYRII